MPNTCTIGPSAVNGERCGKSAVTTFIGSRGEAFAECAEHAFHGIDPETVTIRRYGREYIGRVVKVGARGAVYVEITYNNGVKRVVRAEEFNARPT